MLKHVILSLFVSLGCAGCASHAEVGFEWFNLGTNEIWVTDVIGIPAEASPGRLIQNHAEDQLERSESVYSETVRLGDRITIKWKDNGKQGWPGGFTSPGSLPSGTAHVVELKREDLGIPQKLSNGKIRFTYLGDEKWRVRFLK